MKTIRLFLLGLICLLNGSFTYPGEKEFIGFYHKALDCFTTFDYNQAIDYVNLSISLNPDFDSAYYLRAQINFKRFNYAQAIQDCDRALQINDKYALAYLTKGMSIALLDILSDSMVQEVVSHRGDTAYFDKFRERYWISEGANSGLHDLGASNEVFTKLLSIDSSNSIAYIWRGNNYLNLKHYWEANRDFTTGISFDPYSVDLRLLRAAARAKMEGFMGNRAEEDYDDAIRLAPENGAIYYMRGYYFLTHRFNRIAACQDFNKAMELNFIVADSLLSDCRREFSEADSLFYRGGLLSKQVLQYPRCSCPSWIEKLRNSDTIVPEYQLDITAPNDELFLDEPDDESDDKQGETLP